MITSVIGLSSDAEIVSLMPKKTSWAIKIRMRYKAVSEADSGHLAEDGKWNLFPAGCS